VTPTGDIYILIVTCAAFGAGFLIGLLPLSTKARVWLLVAGPVGWLAWALFVSPAGEDGLALAVIGGYGVLTWWLGLATGHLVHLGFHPSPSGSLRTRLYRLITLR
jgi:hypothetical protein